MDFGFTPVMEQWQQRVQAFLDEVIYPAEETFHEQVAAQAQSNPWGRPPVMAELKAEARRRGLWNLFLPGERGAGLSNLEYAPLAELSGRSPMLAPEAMNCAAPDTGNMEVLTHFAAPAVQQKWLEPPGVEVRRSTHVLGFTDGPHGGHAEIVYDAVRVPRENLLGELHQGFAIGQARLGPGRIHHCMRLIGMAERAYDLMCARVQGRVAFGKPLAAQGVVQEWVAEARIRIEQARLLVLKTAWLMDTVGNRGAAVEISAIKVAVPEMASWVIDRAMQAHGGMGVCQDTPLPELYAQARMLHLADGPDEVHTMSLARRELRRYRPA